MSLVPHSVGMVLDYGCGWGHYSIAIRDKKNIVEAIDLSQNQIDICNIVWGYQDDINFKVSTIDHYSDEKFDYVVSNQVIEHVHNVGNYVSGVNRVLKEGGKLLKSLPNVMNPRFFLSILRNDLESRLIAHSEKMFDQYDKGNDRINAWDPMHFVTLMSSMGFILERYIPSEGVPMPFKFPFGYYCHVKNARISNLSYTMTFLFKKIKKSQYSLKINLVILYRAFRKSGYQREQKC
jgi:SAM-dependent methyltransferase